MYHDRPGNYGTSFGVMLAGLLTEGQLPADTSTSFADCPQNSVQSSTGSTDGSMTLAELIQGTAFDQTVAGQLVADKKIEPLSVTSGSQDYLSSVAKAAVDKGLYTAVVIVPPDFSTALTSLADPHQPQTSATITVYGNAGDSLSAGIVCSVIDFITAQMLSGNIAIGATMAEITRQQPAALAVGSNLNLSNLFVWTFAPGNDLIQLADQPVQAAPTSTAGTLLVTFGSAQALFFALFTGQSGILSMYDERRNWTLQRILVSPTPPWTILGGKVEGTVMFLIGLLLFNRKFEV